MEFYLSLMEKTSIGVRAVGGGGFGAKVLAVLALFLTKVIHPKFCFLDKCPKIMPKFRKETFPKILLTKITRSKSFIKWFHSYRIFRKKNFWRSSRYDWGSSRWDKFVVRSFSDGDTVWYPAGSSRIGLGFASSNTATTCWISHRIPSLKDRITNIIDNIRRWKIIK